MNRHDLIRHAADKIMESNRGGKMSGKSWIAVAAIGAVVVVGFIAYRLILIEFITRIH
ncbi:hypothetical protein ABZ297_25295 [Nonomuraea sp. NPDC005983]|uniref:hypothetical protein n=1 Tax=Nonomuraea sp. NPDC005983 TaxID=3155595 RepID=UPI0033A9B663